MLLLRVLLHLAKPVTQLMRKERVHLPYTNEIDNGRQRHRYTRRTDLPQILHCIVRERCIHTLKHNVPTIDQFEYVCIRVYPYSFTFRNEMERNSDDANRIVFFCSYSVLLRCTPRHTHTMHSVNVNETQIARLAFNRSTYTCTCGILVPVD